MPRNVGRYIGLVAVIVVLGVLVILVATLGMRRSGTGDQPDRVQLLAPAPTAIKRCNVFYTYRVVKSYPHDPNAFTQGLVFEDGLLYESIGLFGQSALRRVDPNTAQVLHEHKLPANLFGEGITILGDKIIQLTWQSRVGFVYDKRTFKRLRQFSFQTEGWGLTHDGKHLIASDGTATLRFLDPNTFAEVRRLTVFDGPAPIRYLNELEYVEGRIFANVWPSNFIAVIAPDTGRVAAWIDLRGLFRPAGPNASEQVLNGIAYDPSSRRLFVTGKLWPRIFEIELLGPRSH